MGSFKLKGSLDVLKAACQATNKTFAKLRRLPVLRMVGKGPPAIQVCFQCLLSIVEGLRLGENVLGCQPGLDWL